MFFFSVKIVIQKNCHYNHRQVTERGVGFVILKLLLTKMNLHHSQESENRKNKFNILDGRVKANAILKSKTKFIHH